MQTKKEVEQIVSTLATKVKDLLKDKLSAVILYGSYARGDYEDYSDIDVMILVDVPKEQVYTYREAIFDISFELGWEHQIQISPVIESTEVFIKYKDASGFFSNVSTEGVRISA